MRRGLVVGKFMPLHRGHQLLIETALARSDELTVVVYDSEVPERWANEMMPVEKRARWVAELYPGIHNIVTQEDTLGGTHEDHDHPKYAQHYADQLAYLGPFTHVFSSEEYGKPFAEALGAEHVMVDAARELVPMSGTKFRQSMYENRAYVDPLVYRDLVQKVVFVGTESTGKSTLAKAMAEELKTLYTEEYGRSLWIERDEQGVKPSFHDLLHVGQTQYMQEQAAQLHANRFLFCDTNAWTTMLWSEMYYGAADTRLIELARQTIGEYKWFLCSNDFDWVQDGYRELKGDKSKNFQRVNEATLQHWGIDYHILSGPVEQRIQQVKDDLGITIGAYA
jgi:NadR type nicotinamide-nucleotide adenylyltransferase